MNELCPCGSNRPYATCCEPIINGRRDATTALELMKSRYVAFTKANVDYLMRSHHSKTRPIKDRKALKKWAASVSWTGLVIIKTQFGEPNDETGFVEFRALYLENGQLQQIHENSFFKREQHKWVYVSGEHQG
ncbi:MAG: YchJ family protein [Prolixibacteraceae bacterium]